MYALMFVMLLAGVSCHAERPVNIPDPYQPMTLHKLPVPVYPTRQKRFVLPILGAVLGTAGEVVTTIGTGLLGAKAGMQQGALAARILNNGGNWNLVYPNQPSPTYYVPNYIPAPAPSSPWNYYDPNNPYGYPSYPSQNGYPAPGPNGYYG